MKRLLIVLFLVLFTACNNEENKEEYESNIGVSCIKHSECKTPMEYLIQSNCPFGTACIENQCKVICPLYYHDYNPNISKSYPFTCEIDSECDCSERGDRTIKCLCVENNCVSVEAE